MTCLPPTCARIDVDLLVDDVGLGPGRPAAGDVVQEVPQHLLPVRGVHHLGVELHAGQAAARRPRTRRPARPSVEAVTVKPSGARGDGVAVAHPHLLLAGQAAQQHAGLGDGAARCGRTPSRRCARPRRRGPASWPGSRSRCRRRARPASNSAGSVRGASSAYTEAGPPDRMIAFGLRASISLDRHRRAARSRSRRAPRAPAGRSAARTARRSRRRERGRRCMRGSLRERLGRATVQRKPVSSSLTCHSRRASFSSCAEPRQPGRADRAAGLAEAAAARCTSRARPRSAAYSVGRAPAAADCVNSLQEDRRRTVAGTRLRAHALRGR